MKHPVDIDNWNRRENYLFLRDFANPYYSVTSQVDVTEAYIRAKALGIKFSHYAMYASLRAVNSIEALRYRQGDGKGWLYDRIRLNTAVAREDHSFASVIIPYNDTLEEFVAEARGIIAAAMRGEGDAYGADSEKDTFVISVNPWDSFTGLQFQFPLVGIRKDNGRYAGTPYDACGCKFPSWVCRWLSGGALLGVVPT